MIARIKAVFALGRSNICLLLNQDFPGISLLICNKLKLSLPVNLTSILILILISILTWT